MKFKNKLKVGQVFKNYKALCDYIGWTPSGGNTKISQLNELERYCYFIKRGHKFEIVTVYEQPKEDPTKNKIGNRGVFVQPLEILLIDFLERSNGLVTISKYDLSCELGLIEKNKQKFLLNKTIPKELSQEISPKTLKEFFDFYLSFFYSKLDSTLNSMYRRNLIDLKEVYVISTKNLTREATKAEALFLEIAKTEAFLELGCANEGSVYLAGLIFEYNGLILSKINKSRFRYIIAFKKSFAISYFKKLEGYEFSKDTHVEIARKRFFSIANESLKRRIEIFKKNEDEFDEQVAAELSRKKSLEDAIEEINKDPQSFVPSNLSEIQETFYQGNLKIIYKTMKDTNNINLKQMNTLVDYFVPLQSIEFGEFDDKIKKFLKI